MHRRRRPIVALLLAGLLGAAPVYGDPKKKGPSAPSAPAVAVPWGASAAVGSAARAGVVAIGTPNGWVLTHALATSMVVILPRKSDTTVMCVSHMDPVGSGLFGGDLYLGFTPVSEPLSSITVDTPAKAWTPAHDLELDRLITASIVPVVIEALRADRKLLKPGADTIIKRWKSARTPIEMRGTDAKGVAKSIRLATPTRTSATPFLATFHARDLSCELNVRFLPSFGAQPAVLAFATVQHLEPEDDFFGSVLSTRVAYAGTSAYLTDASARPASTPTYWRFGEAGQTDAPAGAPLKSIWIVAQATLPASTILDATGGSAQLYSGEKLLGRFEPTLGNHRASDAGPVALSDAGRTSRSGLREKGEPRRENQYGRELDVADIALDFGQVEVPHVHRTTLIGPDKKSIFSWIWPKELPVDLVLGWRVY